MIELDPRLKTPLYEQLYAALADEIRRGDRAPGTPLPGRRTMAAQQGVSVNTVDTAYQMLAAEGLAEPRPRSGFYVQKTYGMLHTRTPRPAPQAVVPAAPKPVGEPATLFDLSTGSVDTALFPARSWGRIQKELLYQRPELLQRGEMQGDAPLRTQIAEYLSVYRGVECTPEQIVVGAGIEYLLGCLAHLFSDGMAAIENPGYFRTRTVLQNSGIPCTLVDIDREGLPADALEALLVATAGWERDVTVDLSGHAEGRNIVSKVLPILQSAGIKASLTDTEDTLSLHVVPGKAQFSDELLPGINVVAAATLLARPAFVGGSVKLSAQVSTGRRQKRRRRQRPVLQTGREPLRRRWRTVRLLWRRHCRG